MRARHKLLQGSIETFREEEDACFMVSTLMWVLPLIVVIFALVDVGFVFLYMKKAHPRKDLLIDEVSKSVKVAPTLSESVAVCDSWIFGANCLHLATKFLPNGLTSLLANLEDENLINKGCESGFTPLHCAVQRNDSLCTR